MEPGSTASIKVARGLLPALFAVNVFRAAMQSITPPEAATYNRFVGPPLRDALALTTANNHVINTLLARISTSIFHLTDLSLRLPSLLGGALYFWAVYRLARRHFGNGPLFLAAVALLSLNPLVLDYLSMARGYGMALAFWMWALELLNPPVTARNLKLAGMCLGLSVASSLAFLAPSVALLVVAPHPRSLRVNHFLIPAFVTAFLILVVPLNHTDFATFNHGATSLRQTMNSLTALSLPVGRASWPALAAVVRIGAALVALATVLVAVRGTLDRLTYILGCTMAVSFVALEVGHRVFKIAFPLGRSALYFIPILTLAGLCLVRRIGWKPLHWAALLASGVYLFQFNVHMYGEWPEYANGRSLVKAIRKDAGPVPVRVAASPGWDQVLNYYRARYALGGWTVQTGPGAGSFDYYVVNQEDARLMGEGHPRVVFRDGQVTVAR